MATESVFVSLNKKSSFLFFVLDVCSFTIFIFAFILDACSFTFWPNAAG